MASIYKRGKTWTASVSVPTDTGYKKKTKSGFLTKKEANNWAIETESQKINDTLTIKDGIVADMFIEWYRVFKEPQLETKSKTWYTTTHKVISDYWPNKRLSEINSKMFQELINDYGKTHVKSSVSHVKNMISSFIRYAVDEDYISKDFTRNIKSFSSVESKDKDLKFLEVDELEKLKNEIIDSDAVSSHMILTAIYSGARYSEVAGLTRDDFDFENNTITINKSWQAEDRAYKSTKTVSSNRVVDMPADFMERAKSWHYGSRFAFESTNGLPPTNNAVNKQLRRYLEKNDSKIITFHGLRHTHASYLLSKDVAIQYVSERLGHADVNITLSVYTHLLEKKRSSETVKALSELSTL